MKELNEVMVRNLAAEAVGSHGEPHLGIGSTREQISMFETLVAFGYRLCDATRGNDGYSSAPIEVAVVEPTPAKLTTAQLNKQVANFIGSQREIGGKIKAIKLIREQKHIGLYEAKVYCDQLQAGMTPFTTKQWEQFCVGGLQRDWLKRG